MISLDILGIVPLQQDFLCRGLGVNFRGPGPGSGWAESRYHITLFGSGPGPLCVCDSPPIPGTSCLPQRKNSVQRVRKQINTFCRIFRS